MGLRPCVSEGRPGNLQGPRRLLHDFLASGPQRAYLGAEDGRMEGVQASDEAAEMIDCRERQSGVFREKTAKDFPDRVFKLHFSLVDQLENKCASDQLRGAGDWQDLRRVHRVHRTRGDRRRSLRSEDPKQSAAHAELLCPLFVPRRERVFQRFPTRGTGPRHRPESAARAGLSDAPRRWQIDRSNEVA